MSKIVIEISSVINPNILTNINAIKDSAKLATESVSNLSKSLSEIGSKTFSRILDVIKESNKAYSDNAIALSKAELAQTKVNNAINNGAIIRSRLDAAEFRAEAQMIRLIALEERQSLAIEKKNAKLLKEQELLSRKIPISEKTIGFNDSASALRNLGGLKTGLSPTSGTSIALEAQILKASIEKIPTVSPNVIQSVINFKNAFLGFIALRATQTLISLSDSYTLIGNKLQLVSETTTQAVSLQKDMFEIANSTRASVLELTQSFVRFDYALKTLGATQSESERFTKTLSEQLSLSGLATSEQSSALLQLSQALNKGKLDGDEFRTVMETLPTLATAIARELGVARGELLKLAPQGKITASVIREAVSSIASETDKAFEKLTPTISQSLEVAKNRVIELIGNFNELTGASSVISESIIFLTKNIYLLAEGLVLVSTVIATKVVPSIVSGAAITNKALLSIVATGKAVTASIAAIATNPIFLIGAAAIAISAALVSAERTRGDELEKRNERERLAWEELVKSRQKYVEVISNETEETKKLSKAYDEYAVLLLNTRKLLGLGTITQAQAEHRQEESDVGKRQKEIDDLIKLKNDEVKTLDEIEEIKLNKLAESFAKQISITEESLGVIRKKIEDSGKEEEIAKKNLKEAELKQLQDYNKRVEIETERQTEIQKENFLREQRSKLGFLSKAIPDEKILKGANVDSFPFYPVIDLKLVTQNTTAVDSVKRGIDDINEKRKINQELTKKEEENITNLTKAYKQQSDVIKDNGYLVALARIKNDLNKEEKEYQDTLRATSKLVNDGIITQAYANLILRDTAKAKSELALADKVYAASFHTEGERRISQIIKERDEVLRLLAARKNASQGEIDGIKDEAKRRIDEVKRQEAEKARFGFNANGAKNSATNIEGTRNDQIAEQERLFKESIAFAKSQGLATEQIEKDNKKRIAEIDREAAEKRIELAAGTFGALAGLAHQFAESGGRAGKIAFEAYKVFAIGEATMSMASAISKANASASFPYNIPAITIAAATGAQQIATITSTNLGGGGGRGGGGRGGGTRGFANGGLFEGAGTTTSDSNLIRISNLEYVVNAEATRNNLPLLNRINANKKPEIPIYQPSPASSTGGGSGKIMVNHNVYNTAGVSVETQTNKKSNGEIDIEVYVKKISDKLASDYVQNKGTLTSAIKNNMARKY